MKTKTNGSTPVNADNIVLIEPEKLKVVDQPMPEMPANIRADLKESIKLKGVKDPIRINSDYEIISGRNRRNIALELGIPYVQCIISDTDEDPTEKILAYDLEIFRRSLSPETIIKLKDKRNKELEKLYEQTYKRLLKKIIPELHDSVEQIYMEEKDIKTIAMIASKPVSTQKALLKEVVVDKKFKGDVKDELQELSKKSRKLGLELKDEKDKFKRLNAKFMETETLVLKLQEGLQEEIENRLKVKETEIEALYREAAPEKVRKLIDKERGKIRKEVEREIAELQENLREMSQSIKDKNSDIEQLETLNEDIARQKKDLENENKALEKALANSKIVIKGLAGTDKIGKRLELATNDINNVFVSIVEVGVEAFEKKDKDWMLKSLMKLHDILYDIDDALQLGLKKAQKMIKKAS